MIVLATPATSKVPEQYAEATLSSVSPWRCITGCGIGPLNHRFTPKVVEKGAQQLKVSERRRVIMPH